MSTQQVIAFWQQVQSDVRLQQQIGSVSGPSSPPEPVALCEISETAGFKCTAEEFSAVEDVVRFWDWVNQDDRMQERLKELQAVDSHDEALGAVVRIAKEAGFQFAADELDAVTKVLIESGGLEGEKLSDEKLEQVVGGALYFPQSFLGALNGSWLKTTGGQTFGAISF